MYSDVVLDEADLVITYLTIQLHDGKIIVALIGMCNFHMNFSKSYRWLIVFVLIECRFVFY